MVATDEQSKILQQILNTETKIDLVEVKKTHGPVLFIFHIAQ